MKIAFIDRGGLVYTPATPYTEPLGGAESTIAYLSAAMAARGHQVALINAATTPGVYLGVQVPGPNTTAEVLNQFDVAIVATMGKGRFMRASGVTIPLVSWQHQAPQTPRVASFGLAEERQAWNAFVYVSDDQREAFKAKFGIDGTVLRNAAAPGVLNTPFDPACFLDRGEDPSLIFASGPGHGLELLLASFAAIRERLPGSRLRICSDQGLYQIEDDPFMAIYALARSLPGVEFVGSVSQDALGREYARADILSYPTNFLETSCIVAIEGAAAGCTFIGTDYGALKETMCGYGVFMPLLNARANFTRDFALLVVDAVQKARANPEAYKQRRIEQATMFRATHTWERRAEEWEAWLDQLVIQPESRRRHAPNSRRDAML